MAQSRKILIVEDEEISGEECRQSLLLDSAANVPHA
jgi:hypothetical protein